MGGVIQSHPSVVSWASAWGFLLRSLLLTYFRGVLSPSGEAMLLCGSAGAPSEHLLWMVCYDYLLSVLCVGCLCLLIFLYVLPLFFCFCFLFTFFSSMYCLIILFLFTCFFLYVLPLLFCFVSCSYVSLSLCALYFCYLSFLFACRPCCAGV